MELKEIPPLDHIDFDLVHRRLRFSTQALQFFEQHKIDLLKLSDQLFAQLQEDGINLAKLGRPSGPLANHANHGELYLYATIACFCAPENPQDCYQEILNLVREGHITFQ